jgi:chromosomal replication initiation ATPase DnaA
MLENNVIEEKNPIPHISVLLYPGLVDVDRHDRSMRLKDIVEIVSNVSGQSPENIVSQSRKRERVNARHVYCWLARRHTTNSLCEIGAEIGHRDHSSVLHGVHNIGNLLYIKEKTVTKLVGKCRMIIKARYGL